MSVCVCVGCVVTGVRVVCDGAAFPQGGRYAQQRGLPCQLWESHTLATSVCVGGCGCEWLRE